MIRTHEPVFKRLADAGAELKFQWRDGALCMHVRRIVNGVPLESYWDNGKEIISQVDGLDSFMLAELSSCLAAMDEQAQKGPPENLKA